MSKVSSSRTRQALHCAGRLLVGYLLAGYPSRDGFLEALKCSVDAGLDMVEIGFPSRNPSNDGAVIRAANQAADLSIMDDMDYWNTIRKTIQVPLWIMGYNEELIDTPRCLRLAKAGIADGFVLPELSAKERLLLNEQLEPYGCDVLGFVNPKTSFEDAENCYQNHALVYLQLHLGQTGTKIEQDEFEPLLKLAKERPGVSVFAGFGIDTRERVISLLDKGFDGAIVGTAIVRKQSEALDSLKTYIRHLKSGASLERA